MVASGLRLVSPVDVDVGPGKKKDTRETGSVV